MSTPPAPQREEPIYEVRLVSIEPAEPEMSPRQLVAALVAMTLVFTAIAGGSMAVLASRDVRPPPPLQSREQLVPYVAPVKGEGVDTGVAPPLPPATPAPVPEDQ